MYSFNCENGCGSYLIVGQEMTRSCIEGNVEGVKEDAVEVLEEDKIITKILTAFC